jgi:hypothetical protein
MDTATGYARRVPRSKYEPPDAEVAAEIDAMVDLHRKVEQAEAEYRAALTKLADKRKVPIAHLADRLGVQRKTVYRHLGRSMT